MKQAPGELGKIQWSALAARGAIENLSPEDALVSVDRHLSAIINRISHMIGDDEKPHFGPGLIVKMPECQNDGEIHETPADVHSFFDAQVRNILGSPRRGRT